MNNRSKSLTTRGKTLASTVDRFFRTNNYLITFLLCIFLLYEMSQTSDFRDAAKEQWATEISVLKKNLGKVHFLTASGQHVVGDKHVIGYADQRFKDYLKNTIIDNVIFGAMVLTDGFDIRFSSPEDILAKTERMRAFEDNFLKTNKTLLKLYREGVYKAIWDGRLPEYLEVSHVKMKEYRTYKDKNGYDLMEGTISVTLLVKSFIKELDKWDNRRTTIKIPFKAYVDILNYADTNNPFGLNIYELSVPVVYKPRADSLRK